MALQIPQTSVATNPPEAIQGMLADTGYYRIDSLVTESVLSAGWGVCKGSTAPSVAPLVRRDCKLPAASTDITANFRGFVKYEQIREPAAAGAGEFPIGATVAVVKQGRIWVLVTQNVAIDGAVYCVYSGADAGKCCADTNSTTAALVPSARYLTAASSGGLACVEINIP